MAQILIRHASWLATMDARREIIKDGAVAIEDGRIVAVGKDPVVAKEHATAEHIIDGSKRLVMPGLVDGHVHNSQHLAKGLGDEVEMNTWLYERIYPFEAEMTEEDAYLGARLCQLELIKAGTTCFFDPGSYFPDAVVRALKESGLRGVVSRSTLDIHEGLRGKVPEGSFRESTEEAAVRGEEFVRRTKALGSGRMVGSFSLRLLTDCSDELCSRVGELSARYDAMIQTHGDSSRTSAETSRKTFGQTGVERLSRLGILGPRVLLIHMGGVTPGGVLLMREAKANGVACPVASAHHGGTTSPYLPEIYAMGVNVCLGSDSGANGNFLDVVRAMNFASLSSKRDRNDPEVLRPEHLLEMATTNGAKAAMLEHDIGSIEPGKRADITLFNLAGPESTPLYNPIANLVYSGSGANAETVIVDGEILMLNRKVCSMPEEQVIEEGQKAALQIAERAGLGAKAAPRWPVT